MAEYKCYSDASYQAGRAGYGIVIRKNSVGYWEEHHREHGPLIARCSKEAELLAMIRGLLFVPDDQAGIIYTDLHDIIPLIVMRKQWTWEFAETTSELCAQIVRTGLTLEKLPRKHRPHEYTECHRLSRSAIGIDPNKRKAVRSISKVRKWGRLYC